MTRALVTGATGFIGSHLVDALLQRGYEVRCLVRGTSETGRLRALGVELIVAELHQFDAVRNAVAGVDEVYHLAGLTAALTVAEMERVNRGGAAMVARAAADQCNPPKLILVSSIAAAGPARRHQVRVENDPEQPISTYGRTKLAGEREVKKFAKEMPVTIVRPGIVFGPRNRSMLPVLRGIMRFAVHIVPGFQSPPLSYIYVADLVELMLRAAEVGTRAADGAAEGSVGEGIYFAVGPEYPSWAELGRIVGPYLGRPHLVVVPCAMPIPWIVAGVSEVAQRVRGKADELNFDKIREATVQSWACSSRKAQCDLGFAPSRPFEQRWRETIDWYRDARWL